MVKNLIRAIIIDDEQDGRYVLQDLLSRIPEVKLIAIANDADSGFDAVVNMQPDVVFFDICMPNKLSLSLVEKFMENGHKTTFVFVTAYDKFGIEAIKLSAFDYLLKPVDPDELSYLIQHFKTEHQEKGVTDKIPLLMTQLNHSGRIRLNTRSGFCIVDPSEIIYIQADGNYSKIIFSIGRTEMITQQIGSLAGFMPNGNFFRISRSNLINLTFLTKVDRKSRKCELVCKGETYELQISRNLIHDFDLMFR